MILSVIAGGIVVSAPATSTSAETPLADGSSDTTPATIGAPEVNDPIAQTANETAESNQPPSIGFSITPTDPEVGDGVEFDAEATDPNGEVDAYEWRVNNEFIASNATTGYVFPEAGTHEIRLTVTDDQGGTASLTRVVTISANKSTEETLPVTEGAVPESSPGFTTEKPARDPVVPFLSGPIELDEGLDPAVTDTARDRVWTVFQFHRQPTAEELDRLQSLEYQQRSVLADRTYYAAIPPQNAEEAIALESVRSIVAIAPRWKITPRLDDRLTETDELAVRVTVRSFERPPEEADELGLDRIRERTYRGELTGTQIRTLQQRAAVRWIEPFNEPKPLLAESVGVAGAQRVAFPGVDGSGVRVGVVDTGIEHGHPHFSGVNVVDSYDKNDNDNYPEADRFGWRFNDHGTHVAGTIAGSSVVDGTPLVGVAPNSTLVVARGLGEDQFQRVHNNGTDIISNSWGGGDFTGRYTSDDAFSDRWARAHPQSVLIAANGNWNSSDPREQYANSPGIAKNVISVGAINDGTGTTDALNNVAWLNNMTAPNDGRRKPDINAPGARIESSILNSTYGNKVGTSMATPHVSGVAALYEDEYSGQDPDASEMKAAMIATAGPVQNPNPSERAEGYGAINAHNMLYNNSYESRQLNYQGNFRPPLPTANTHRFNVANDANKVVVSLAWLDPPGDPATTDTLVNDLDLYVGPASDPKRYSVTDRDQSVNRLVVDNLSPSERGSQWVVTVEPHNMWTGLGADKPSQAYDGTIRVVTKEHDLSVTVPDRIVVEPQQSVTESFEAEIDATGAPVHGIRTFIDSDTRLGDCSGTRAHKDEHVVGILSEDYLSGWSERLCFDVPDEAGTYPVNTKVRYTDQSGQTATIEQETIIEVAKPRAELKPFKRNVTTGETATYELVVGNLSDGVGKHELYVSLDRPPVGALTDFTVVGSPASETVQVDPSSDKAWISVEADGVSTTDYGTATLGILEAEGQQIGKSNISVEVLTLEDRFGGAYSLRTQGSTLNTGVPPDGQLNVTRGPPTDNGITIEPPPINGSSGIVVIDTPVTIQLDQGVITNRYDAEAETVEWTFGDGTTGSGLTTEHTYAESGSYDIVGRVGLSDGRVIELSRTVDVQRETGDGVGVEIIVAEAPDQVNPGGEFTATYTITNRGEQTTAYTLESVVGMANVSVTEFTGAIQSSDPDGETPSATTDGIDAGATGSVGITYTVAANTTGAASIGVTTLNPLDGFSDNVSHNVLIEATPESPEDPTQRVLQITSKDDPSALTQNDVTAVITRFNRGQSIDSVEVTQNDVTTAITLFERS